MFGVLVFVGGIKYLFRKPKIKAVDNSRPKYRFISGFHLFLNLQIIPHLSILLQASVNLTDSFPIVIPLMANSFIETKLHQAFSEVLKGTSFSQALKEVNLFRSDFLEMVKVGEQSGELGAILDATTAYFDEQVLDNMQNLVGLIEPTLIVLIACLIIVIMSIVFFPLMNIMKYRF